MATTHSRKDEGDLTRRSARRAVACQEFELTTRTTTISRAARDRDAAVAAVMSEIWRQVNARRVEANQECGGDCELPGETCIHTLVDDVEPRIRVRRAFFMAPPAGDPNGAPVPTIGYIATLQRANIKSRCECALIV